LVSRCLSRQRDGQVGASAVEFALVVPLLLSLVCGIIQFGVFFAQQVALNGAVRSGARFGSVNAYSGSHTCGAVVQEVRDSAGTIAMNGSDVAVQVFRSGQATAICDTAIPSTLTTAPAPCVNPAALVDSPDTLTVTARFNSKYLVPLPIGGTSKNLAGSGTYQCEYNK
jgi:Flp pilus assembly protein TadG